MRACFATKLHACIRDETDRDDAIESSVLALVDAVLEKNSPEINCANSRGQTALMGALRRGYLNVALRLVKECATRHIDTNVVDLSGNDAMIELCKTSRTAAAQDQESITRKNRLTLTLEVASLLLDKGVDVWRPNRKGHTAIYHARRNSKPLFKLLQARENKLTLTKFLKPSTHLLVESPHFIKESKTTRAEKKARKKEKWELKQRRKQMAGHNSGCVPKSDVQQEANGTMKYAKPIFNWRVEPFNYAHFVLYR